MKFGNLKFDKQVNLFFLSYNLLKLLREKEDTTISIIISYKFGITFFMFVLTFRLSIPSHNSKYYAKSLKTNSVNSQKITTLFKRKLNLAIKQGHHPKNRNLMMSLIVVLIAKHFNLSCHMIIQRYVASY